MRPRGMRLSRRGSNNQQLHNNFKSLFYGIAWYVHLLVRSEHYRLIEVFKSFHKLMKKINWGIIGCGDVTEIKSGPAFNKVNNSSLVAVMRRDAKKAEDFAQRHNVPRWYNEGDKLINDPEVNAIYVATPPSSHEEYAIAAINAGKPVYLEKPMANTYAG